MLKDIARTALVIASRLPWERLIPKKEVKAAELLKSLNPNPPQSPPSPVQPSPIPPLAKTEQEAVAYSFECLIKHLGGASVLLREAFERAIDDGMGAGTAEKVVEALNEHSAAEPDIEKMLNIPEVKDRAEKLLSGIRQMRKAAWEAGLPIGKGTKEDIEAMRLWNTILLKEALEGAERYPGTLCVQRM